LSAFYVVPYIPPAWCSGNTYVTCAGTVRAPHGAGVARKVEVFHDTCTTPLNSTISTVPLGTFTMQVPGLPTTHFTVIAHGVDGENSVIYSHCQDI